MKRAVHAVFAALFILAVGGMPVFSQDTAKQPSAKVNAFALRVSDREKLVAEIPLHTGHFDHVFVHSIHLTPVIERFEIVLNKEGIPILHLYELEYESSGMGMPSDTENGYRLLNGKFILDISRDFTVIPVMVSIVAGHGIVADNRFYPFTDWVPEGTQLFLAAIAAF